MQSRQSRAAPPPPANKPRAAPNPSFPARLQIKRTEGVSTTDIVGRMLMCSRSVGPGSEDDKVGHAGPGLAGRGHCGACIFSRRRPRRRRSRPRRRRPRPTPPHSPTLRRTDAADPGVQPGTGGIASRARLRRRRGAVTVRLAQGTQRHRVSVRRACPLRATHHARSDAARASLGVEVHGGLALRRVCRRETPRLARHSPHPPLLEPPPTRSFMPTSRRIVQFSSGRVPPPGATIVYIDGAFDLFHTGHIDILKVRARADWKGFAQERPAAVGRALPGFQWDPCSSIICVHGPCYA